MKSENGCFVQHIIKMNGNRVSPLVKCPVCGEWGIVASANKNLRIKHVHKITKKDTVCGMTSQSKQFRDFLSRVYGDICKVRPAVVLRKIRHGVV